MRYAVLSDIHGNAEALEAVLEVADCHGVEAYLCLGDIVGYGPDPARVVGEVVARGMVSVRGNHDEAAVNPDADRYFNDLAAHAIAWTRERLSDAERSVLSELPLTCELDGVLLVHASPGDPGAWRYLLSASEAEPEFREFGQRLCLIGHSHVPMVVAHGDDGFRQLPAGDIRLEPAERYIVNVGSVGQPRDGDARACFVVLDDEEARLRFVRVAYAAERTREKILAVGLPAVLGDRLLVGR